MSRPLEWLFALEQFGIKFGLGNIQAIVAALGHPEHAFRSLHIAGTNGKGSVAAMADAALRAAGVRSALYTSPHLVDLAERFRIDGRPVDPAPLEIAVADVRRTVEQLMDDGGLPASPTFFEVTTAVGFELFRRAEVAVAVCEVGMGGRLDATNVLAPVATAITSIGLDHQQYLGSTLREIALEKAGIIKPAVPIVVGALPEEAAEAIAAVAASRQAPLVRAHDGVTAARTGPSGPLRLRTPAHDYGSIELALSGRHQVDNAVVAVRLLETLAATGPAVPPAAIVAGLRGVRWPGRLDHRRLADGRELLLDAAHNPDGAAALAAYLTTLPARPVLVFGAMRDKDTQAMLRTLAPVVDGLVLTSAAMARSADPAVLAEQARAVAPGLRLIIEPAVPAALAAAWRLSPSIVVAGSVFLIAAVIKECAGSW